MTSPLHRLTAPSLEAIEAMALAARDGLPAAFRHAARDVAIRVADLADEPTLQALEITDPYELSGLYDGIPLTEKSVLDQPAAPDTIWLYRLAILDEWIARRDVALGDLVGHVLIHEFAHHFGWSDHDIARIDPWWE